MVVRKGTPILKRNGGLVARLRPTGVLSRSA